MSSNESRANQPIANTPSLEESQPAVEKIQRAYERPVVISHSGEDVLEELGPAQACYPFTSCGAMP